ncbi:ABC transporter substrate-binding protein [Phreatobacter sp.]|uniref:ABC transporter substrate-binding protein n=1 Tax=Phreatobacter sp. TaxID=1966341 RepID=UPI003F6F0EFF
MQKPLRLTRRTALAGVAATLAAPGIARAQARTLKIGSLLPRSGFFAQAGQSMHRGVLAAPELLKELGYAVEIVHIDTESNADVARTQAERAINDGCHVLTGAFDSGHTLAIAQVAEQRQIPFVVNVAAAPQITEQGYKFLVRNFQTGGQLVTNGLRLIKDVMDAKGVKLETAVFLHANDTFGTAQRNAMDAIWPRVNLPINLVEKIAYDPRAQDLSVEVTKIRSLNPDLVMCVTRASDAIKMVRDMVRQRFQPKAIISPGSPGFYDEEFYQALGPLADFVLFGLPWANPRSTMTQAFEKAFAKANPNNRFAVDSFNAGFAFEGLLIAADAFKRAGTTAGPQLMEAVRATSLAEHIMIGGPITFDAKGQNPNIGSALVQNLKRVPTVVLPKDVAVAEPVLPFPAWQGRS